MENNMENKIDRKLSKKQYLPSKKQSLLQNKTSLVEKLKQTVKENKKYINVFTLDFWSHWFSHVPKELLTIGLVVGIIFLVGYFKGKHSSPIHLNGTKPFIVEQGGVRVERGTDGILRINGKPAAESSLVNYKPYGSQIAPMLILDPSGVGIGVNLLYFYNFGLDCYVTPKLPGLNVGISYKININRPIKINNTYLGSSIKFAPNGTKTYYIYSGLRF